MIFILSKLLLFAIMPLAWIIFLLGAAIFTKQHQRKRKFVLAAILLLLIFSNTYLLNIFTSFYEANYPTKKQYKVGLVLGGFADENESTDGVVFYQSSDRLLQTLALYKKGDIEKIMISSGSARVFGKEKSEATVVANYLREIGIPDSAVVVEQGSRNTKENLLNTVAFLKDVKQEDILVITSAWHIPRTKILAKKVGLTKLSYYPTNHFYINNLQPQYYIFPNADTLQRWTILMKELVGCAAAYIGIT